MSARVLSLAVLVFAACRSPAPSNRAGDNSVVESPAAATRQSASHVAVQPIGPVVVCESVAVLWRATGGATVIVGDTVARVQTPDTIDRNQGRFFNNAHGCVTSADAPAGIDSGQHAGLYWTASAERGWVDLSELDADGPDGNVRTRRRSRLLCQIQQFYDGGNDADSTYVPSPRHREVTICWRSGS